MQMGGSGGWYCSGCRKNVDKGTDSGFFGEVDSVRLGDYLEMGWEKKSWQEWLPVTV